MGPLCAGLYPYHSQEQELGKAQMATGLPLALGLEVSLGTVRRLRKLSKGSHIIEEGRLDSGFIVPHCKIPAQICQSHCICRALFGLVNPFP